MLPNVRIILTNGNLGSVIQFAEGVAGLIGTGVAVTGKIGIGDPRLVFSLSDAEAIGLDATNNPVAHRHIKEFYDEAGTGAELYVMLVPDTMTQADMWDKTNGNGLNMLLDFAAGRVRIAGSFFTSPSGYVLDLSGGVDADVFSAVANGHRLATDRAALQTPLRGIVEGCAYSGAPADLTDLTTMANNRMAVVIGGSQNDSACGIGQVLGRLAAIPVQRKISRVKNGPLIVTNMYLGGERVDTVSGLDLIHDKGYIVPRTFPNLTGYYWGSDHTATADTDDYSSIARGRVIDKAAVIAYVTYVQELDDDIDINADGTLPTGVVAHLKSKIEQQINGSMNGEISKVTAYINPAQNVLQSNSLTVGLSIIPKGYTTNIEVNLGFDNPLA